MFDLAMIAASWAFFGLFAGLWKLAIAGGALALFIWKQGGFRHPLWRLLSPRVRSAVRPSPPEPAPARAASPAIAPSDRPATPRPSLLLRLLRDRWTALLLFVALLTLLAWVATRMTIQGAGS